MKRTGYLITAMFVLLFSLGLKKGEKIPGFVLRDLKNRIVYRSDICGPGRKGVVIIDFFATWCKPCKKALPVLDKINREFSKKGLRIVLISYKQKNHEVSEFFKDKKYNFSVLWDPYGEIGKRFEVTALPRTFVVNASDCSIVKIFYGESKNLYQSLRKVLLPLVRNGNKSR